MSTKSTRSGGKYSGSHTTVIPLAAAMADIAHKRKEVTKISLGFITAGLSPSRSGSRVKIGYGNNGHVLLQVRGNTAQQEIHVFTTNPIETKLALARGARNLGVHISFEKKEKSTV